MAARNKPAVTAEGLAQSPNVDVHLALDMEKLCSTAPPAAVHDQMVAAELVWQHSSEHCQSCSSSSPQLALAIDVP